MPSVKTQTSLKAVAEPKAVPADKITQADLIKYIPLFTEYVEATKELNKLKKKFEAQQAFFLLTSTGLKDIDEIKSMTPEQVEQLVTDRMNNGQLLFEEGEYDYTIAPSGENGRQTVPWKEIVLELKGEAFVLDKAANAPKTFSYKVIPTQGSHPIAD